MVLSPLCLCGWRATPGMAEHPWWRLTDSVRFTWAFLVLSRNPPLLGTLGQLVILSWTNLENLLPWLLGPLSSLSFPQEK